MWAVDDLDRLTRFDLSLLEHAEIPPAAPVALNDGDHVAYSVSSGQRGARLTRFGDLQTRSADSIYIAEAGTVLREALHRQIFAEGSRTDVVASPFRPPRRIVGHRIHQHRLIGTAVNLRVGHGVASDPKRGDPRRTGNWFLPDGTGESAVHGIARVWRARGAWGADLDGNEAHGRK